MMLSKRSITAIFHLLIGYEVIRSEALQSYSCPSNVGASVQLPVGKTVQLVNSKQSELCMVTVSDEYNENVPVARSYDNYEWEATAGPYSSIHILCSDISDSCEITIPAAASSKQQTFVITRFPTSVAKSQSDEIARFLEQATFGTTASEIEVVKKNKNYGLWIKTQMQSVAPTLHRVYWRQRMNPRLPTNSLEGRVTHPCEAGARFRRAAFTEKDKFQTVLITQTSSGLFAMTIGGQLRTMVASIDFKKEDQFSYDGPALYRICAIGTPSRVGGTFGLLLPNGNCSGIKSGNPPVYFDTNNDNYPAFVMPTNSFKKGFVKDGSSIDTSERLISIQAPTDSTCDLIPPLVVPEGSIPVFLKVSNTVYFIFDPTLVWDSNLVESPIPDGGGSTTLITQTATRCSNVPMTFLNEDQCIISNDSSACSPQEVVKGPIILDSATILLIYKISNRYVYAVKDLRIEDDVLFESPCVQGIRSRWRRLWGNSSCNVNVAQSTSDLFSKLIKTSVDSNTSLKDIYMPETGSCASDDISKKEIYIQFGDECWKSEHPDYLNVYDFTYWTRSDTHPGNTDYSNPIKRFAKNGSDKLEFPKSHPMERWNMYKLSFTHIGKLGDKIDFQDLPDYIKSDDLARALNLDISDKVEGAGIKVCGSPGESSNLAMSFSSFDLSLGSEFDTTSNKDFVNQRKTVWSDIAFSAPDQLRQRMAWALSQLLVISESFSTNTEIYLGYYDIFVRNAFGNYRDILREVAYSSMMADMLSYYSSKSTEYVWKKFNQVQYADENFAREIMQLFTVGLINLNMDGTPKLSNTGKPVRVYSNDDIMEYARSWTGFRRQPSRGNYEERADYSNSIDPMTIDIAWRDTQPKLGLDNKYVGDGYALCEDLPDRTFLRKGAKYRLLGKSKAAELTKLYYRTPDDKSDIQVLNLSPSSELKSLLCQPDSKNKGVCQYPSTVTLDYSLNCDSDECNVETVHVVQVNDDVYYEHVKTPCVHLSFFDTGKVVKSNIFNKNKYCVNKYSIAATEACCDSKGVALRNTCAYTSEVVSYYKAKDRCSSISSSLCNFSTLKWTSCNKCCNYRGDFWTNVDCQVVVVVRSDGKVAIERYDDPKSNYHSLTFFRVIWEEDYPTVKLDNCGNICENVNGYCRCEIKVVNTRTFFEAPYRHEILSSLAIGWLPSAVEEFDSKLVEDDIITHFQNSYGEYDTNTVFEVKDDFGRTLFLRNMESTVSIIWSSGTVSKFKFRNPPTFHDKASQISDAMHETEAVLDHVFYHDNTAPFLASRFIQRFGISNPSPRFVRIVAEAFKEGSYFDSSSKVTFGNNEYGDLSAMVAAILLDRESRNSLLDSDPTYGSLREPLIKVVAAMRSLNYKSNGGLVKFHGMTEKIGQMAHEIQSVFSFFLPEYAPPGPIIKSSLVSPEAMTLHGSLGLMNGLISLVKNGLTGCYGGFGSECKLPDVDGYLLFKPKDSKKGENVVSELATLLTSGRMSAQHRQIIANLFNSESDKNKALIVAQQLALSTPEFHSTGISYPTVTPTINTNVKALAPKGSPAPCKKYKAVVHILLQGGADSYNMLVPHSKCQAKDMYQEYRQARGSVALSKKQLLPINAGTSSQSCSVFGLHPRLKVLQNLYNENAALFFANIGVLTEPVSKENYSFKTVTQLFAHNAMQSAIGTLDPFSYNKGTGTLGRIADVLSSKGYACNSFSLDTTLVALAGSSPSGSKVSISSKAGFQQFNSDPSSEYVSTVMQELNTDGGSSSNLFSSTWSSSFSKSLQDNDGFYWAQETSKLKTVFPDTKVGQQLMRVSQMIDTNECRGSERDVFYLEVGPYDHHSMMLENLDTKLSELNGALESFVSEIKRQNRWDDVTVVFTSDFGRTLSPNSGEGTDHGWSGHSFMLGGNLKGGRILGEYPSDLTDDGPLTIGRGRLYPTLPWESVWNAVAKWFGVTEEDELNTILPNRKAFPQKILFEGSDLFSSIYEGNVKKCPQNIYVNCVPGSGNNGGGNNGSGSGGNGNSNGFQDGSISSASSSSSGMVGAIAGSLVVAAVAVIVLLLFRRKRNSRENSYKFVPLGQQQYFMDFDVKSSEPNPIWYIEDATMVRTLSLLHSYEGEVEVAVPDDEGTYA